MAWWPKAKLYSETNNDKRNDMPSNNDKACRNLTLIQLFSHYLLSKPITKQQKRRRLGWVMVSGPSVFIYYLGPLYSKFKKTKPSPAKPLHQLFKHHNQPQHPTALFPFLFSILSLFLSFSSLFSLSSSPVLLYKAHYFVLKEGSFYTYGDQTLLPRSLILSLFSKGRFGFVKNLSFYLIIC